MDVRAVLFTTPGRLTTVDALLRQFGWETTVTTAESEVLESVGSGVAGLVVIGATAGLNRAGIELTRGVRARDRACGVLLFTAVSSEEFAVEALRAGASDLLLESALHSEIAAAIARVAERMDELENPSHLTDPLQGGRRMVGT